MTISLILARHGNTFNQGEPVVWVGSRNDLPLVEEGRRQAEALGYALMEANMTIAAIYAGPLQRTRDYAALIQQRVKLHDEVTIDSRLNEIDYGQWSGLSSAEVTARFGADSLLAWEKTSTWPQYAEWGESAEKVSSRIVDFAHHLIQAQKLHATYVVVASNGCLRYFLDLIPGKLAGFMQTQTAKIATGHIGRLTFDGRAWAVVGWNESPSVLVKPC